jgi:hypothetical protein
MIIACSHIGVLAALDPSFFAARGVRKVTTGITGLWRRSVQSDAAF